MEIPWPARLAFGQFGPASPSAAGTRAGRNVAWPLLTPFSPQESRCPRNRVNSNHPVGHHSSSERRYDGDTRSVIPRSVTNREELAEGGSNRLACPVPLRAPLSADRFRSCWWLDKSLPRLRCCSNAASGRCLVHAPAGPTIEEDPRHRPRLRIPKAETAHRSDRNPRHYIKRVRTG